MNDYKKAREKVAKLVGIELKELTYVLYKEKVYNLYKTFKIPKKNGDFRIIHAPKDNLKWIQRKLSDTLVEIHLDYLINNNIKSVEEAIEICNKSEYGLQSAVFTKDFAKAFKIAKELEVGTVQINNKTQRGPDNFAFLGVKGSGAGVQGIKYSIESMTRVKSMQI